MTAGRMDDRSILSVTQFVGTRLHVDAMQTFSVGCSLPPKGAAREMPGIEIKPPLGAPLLNFSSRLSPEVFSARRHFHKTAVD